ncbi:MAG: polysaccharide biosynthesis tyrosine autokinase [Gammaproteobacteria bacterium]
MERIKQALERAKKDRESGRTSRPAAIIPQRVQTGAPRSEDIVYTQTKVFKPPQQVLDENRVLGGAAAGQATDAYRMLRTRVLQKMRDNGWNSLMVTSAGVGEGKSLTATNLAISLAREVTHTVLLVDLDLRRPGLHELFGYTAEAGLVDCLRDKKPLSDVLVNPGVERLVLLPARQRVENSSELLGSPEMLDVIADIKNRYPDRIVIFDLPPVLSTDDALAFSPNVDAVLLVVQEGETSQSSLRAVYDVLSDSNILGVVLNRADDYATAYY